MHQRTRTLCLVKENMKKERMVPLRERIARAYPHNETKGIARAYPQNETKGIARIVLTQEGQPIGRVSYLVKLLPGRPASRGDGER